MSQAPAIDPIIDFWFRDENTGRLDLPQKRWFAGSDAFDESIRNQFGDWIDPGADGELDAWLHSPTGTLALIVLLDQFPRNIYRRQAKAFAYEDKALASCKSCLASGQDKQLPIIQRVFLYMPLEHSEAMADQEESLAAFKQLQHDAPPDLQEFADGTWDFAVKHYDIIKRFGRYPHRNEVLERESTKEEQEWMVGGGASFGQ